jgi:hypothetical protein
MANCKNQIDTFFAQPGSIPVYGDYWEQSHDVETRSASEPNCSVKYVFCNT